MGSNHRVDDPLPPEPHQERGEKKRADVNEGGGDVLSIAGAPGHYAATQSSIKVALVLQPSSLCAHHRGTKAHINLRNPSLTDVLAVQQQQQQQQEEEEGGGGGGGLQLPVSGALQPTLGEAPASPVDSARNPSALSHGPVENVR
ncbi:unnamed protein product [Pleuronectes platessa]|uniref:Uncharacterized protein n=1 Tax=Pleuronectes platessa TaxID=8262 RepID=A0A9N7VVD4_PLEPL|nr:unnamed protein product [Pleuronectes platessa]